MAQQIDSRFRPFLPLSEGKIYVEYNDFLVPLWQDVTFDLTPVPPGHVGRPMHNLYVFGRVVFRSESIVRPILKFLSVYVFGTLELQGVNLSTEQMVVMTVPQMIRGIESILQKTFREKPERRSANQALSFSPLHTQSLRITSDINGGIYRGVPILTWAAQCNDKLFVELLIEAKADIEVNFKGWTALGWALQNRHLGVTKTLIRGGANVECVVKKLLRQKETETARLLRTLECKAFIFKVAMASPINEPSEDSSLEEKHSSIEAALAFRFLGEAANGDAAYLAVIQLIVSLRRRIDPLSLDEIAQFDTIRNYTIIKKNSNDPRMRTALRILRRSVNLLGKHSVHLRALV